MSPRTYIHTQVTFYNFPSSKGTWGSCNGALATKENLWLRKCSLTPLCPCCASFPEIIEHLLLLCDWSRQVWFCSSFAFRMEKKLISRFDYWLCSIFSDLGLNDFEKAGVAWLCWYIWRNRCSLVFEKCSLVPTSTVAKASFANAQ